MVELTVAEAQADLGAVLERVRSGEVIRVKTDEGAVFEIRHITRPLFGSGRGLFKINEGFDDPLEDFEPYM